MSISEKRVRQIVLEEAQRALKTTRIAGTRRLKEGMDDDAEGVDDYDTGSAGYDHDHWGASGGHWASGHNGLQYMGGDGGGLGLVFDRFNTALADLADYANEEAPDDEADGEMLSVFDAAMHQVKVILGTAAGRED
jgi:hypothetical protein